MKLRAVVNLENQNNQCQFGIEVDLDENAEIDEIQEKTNKATAALKIAITVRLFESFRCLRVYLHSTEVQAIHGCILPPYALRIHAYDARRSILF